MQVEFMRNSLAPWEIYQQNYVNKASATSDADFVLTNGFWYDINGVLFPAGSVFATRVTGLGLAPLGVSLSLAGLR